MEGPKSFEEPKNVERHLRTPKKRPSQFKMPPHTEESLEEEQRLNPERHAAKGKGYATPFLKVEDIADTGMSPEEELMAKEEELTEEDYKEINGEIDEEDEKELSRRLREEDYPEYYSSREEWERHLRSLSDQDYAMRLRAKFARKEREEAQQDTETAPHDKREIERQVPEALLQQPKQEKVSPHTSGEEMRIKSDKQRGAEKRKSQRALPKSVKARRKFRKEIKSTEAERYSKIFEHW